MHPHGTYGPYGSSYGGPYGPLPPRRGLSGGKLAGVALVLVMAVGAIHSGRIPSPELGQKPGQKPGQKSAHRAGGARPGPGPMGSPAAAESVAAAGKLGGVMLAGAQTLLAGIDWDALRAVPGSIGTGLSRLLETRTIDHSPTPHHSKHGKPERGGRKGQRGAISYGDVHARPAGKGTAKRCAKAGYDAGFRGERLVTFVAVALAESGCDFTARCHNCIRGYAEDSRCAMQVNVNAHPQFRGSAIYRPAVCARAAWKISNGGTNWYPWSTYRFGTYREHLGVARRAVQG